MNRPKDIRKVKPEDLTEDEVLGLLGLFNDEGSLVIIRGEELLEVQKSELREWFEITEWFKKPPM
ncbi:MAG: hypothetical protein KF802_02690 [Bdellovibrionaceae bacterium]|nr:hypothetical protein [Pseudobdellovibrionaceae bacterium]